MVSFLGGATSSCNILIAPLFGILSALEIRNNSSSHPSSFSHFSPELADITGPLIREGYFRDFGSDEGGRIKTTCHWTFVSELGTRTDWVSCGLVWQALSYPSPLSEWEFK
jgi:hypothetical protein